MYADLLIYGIRQLVTLAGGEDHQGPRRGSAMRELGIIEDGAVAVRDGRISAVGSSRDLCGSTQAQFELDAEGRAAIPGLVDAHTHLPWAGERMAEFEMRIGGATYIQIMNAGGGIARTMQDTRQATISDLMTQTRTRMDRMLVHGTTTAEAKTGYGLNLSDEIKQLEAIAELHRTHSVDLVPTFLGAHAVPPEYAGRADAYVDLLVEEMTPAVQARWAALRVGFDTGWPIFCDVFCEPGAFDVAQSRRILEAGRSHGLGLKLHVDEFAPLGGTPLAVEMQAVSADHLVTTPAEHLCMLASSATVGVSLPGTPFGLGQHHYTPARALIDQGGALALATDLNPGTCWCESMQFIMALACRYMRLLPAEALTAATINAAYAIGLGDRVGSLQAGKLADLVLLDADDYRSLAYHFGTNLANTVIKRGRIVAGSGART